MLAIIYAGIVHHINPPSNIETIDPKTLHLSGEFTEANLGTSGRSGRPGDEPDRRDAVRLPAAMHRRSANRAVTLRFATPDVIHGILVTGTNVNTMVVPGYVSQVHTVFTKTGDLLMPCHEYCGLGHSQMWATVRVVPESEFKPDADGRATCDAR